MAHTPLVDAITAALLCGNVAQACRGGLLCRLCYLAWGLLGVLLGGRPIAAVSAASERLHFSA